MKDHEDHTLPIPAALVDVHDLRRTFTTIGESLDISVYTLKRLLNHRTNAGGVAALDLVPNVAEHGVSPLALIDDCINAIAPARLAAISRWKPSASQWADPSRQNCLGSPASCRIPLAVCRDLIFVGTVNGRSLCGLVQTSWSPRPCRRNDAPACRSALRTGPAKSFTRRCGPGSGCAR